MKSNYIVYALLDKNSKPFYIGMGTPSRPYQHFVEAKNLLHKQSNKKKIFKIRKILRITRKYPKIEVYCNGLSHKEACELERKLIFKIGIDNLTNLKDGGKGGFFNSWKKELVEKSILKMKRTKKKLYKKGIIKVWNKGLTKEIDGRVKKYVEKGRITKILLGRNKGKKHPLYGKLGSEHPAYGYKHSKRERLKISASKLGLKNPRAKKCKISTPDNKIYTTCVNEFIRLYGKEYKVVAHFLRKLANKDKGKSGWKVIYTK